MSGRKRCVGCCWRSPSNGSGAGSGSSSRRLTGLTPHGGIHGSRADGRGRRGVRCRCCFGFWCLPVAPGPLPSPGFHCGSPRSPAGSGPPYPPFMAAACAPCRHTPSRECVFGLQHAWILAPSSGKYPAVCKQYAYACESLSLLFLGLPHIFGAWMLLCRCLEAFGQN